MQGAATKAMPLRIGEERQRRRRPRAAATACGGWPFARDASEGRESLLRPHGTASRRAKGQTRRPHPFFSSLLEEGPGIAEFHGEHFSPGSRPGATGASLIGTFRPGLESHPWAVAGRSVAAFEVRKCLSALRPRSSPPREAPASPGLAARPESRTESPDAEGSPRGPSKPRWSAPAGSAQPRCLPCSGFAERRAWKVPLTEPEARRVSPRGILRGGAALSHGPGLTVPRGTWAW
jgi:hypothetical protein